MEYELIKARLNLHAVLKNLEDLVKYDPEMAKLSGNWNLSIQFLVAGGPKAYIEFTGGKCSVGQGKCLSPSIKLFFLSPAHLNRMMDGKGNPIPLKGFTKIPFLTGDFTKLTDRLEHYLRPTEDRLKDKRYLELNTRFTLNTAAFAIRELGELDSVGKQVASHIPDGAVLMKILPDGPAVNILFQDGRIQPGIGEIEHPMACMFMKNIQVANDFLNARIDAFTAIASGDVAIKGRIPMLDSLSLILDRIPRYLA